MSVVEKEQEAKRVLLSVPIGPIVEVGFLGMRQLTLLPPAKGRGALLAHPCKNLVNFGPVIPEFKKGNGVYVSFLFL